MFAKAPTSILPGYAAQNCKLPVHNLSAQTRHIVDEQGLELQRSQKMLSIFALVLSLALAVVLFLMITGGPANAMPVTSLPKVSTDGCAVAIGAFLSLSTCAGLGFALVKTQISSAVGR